MCVPFYRLQRRRRQSSAGQERRIAFTVRPISSERSTCEEGISQTKTICPNFDFRDFLTLGSSVVHEYFEYTNCNADCNQVATSRCCLSPISMDTTSLFDGGALCLDVKRELSRSTHREAPDRPRCFSEISLSEGIHS